MADSLDEKHIETRTNLAATPAAAHAAQDAADRAVRTSADTAAEARKARIKKMRGWLSPRDSVADDFGPEDAALYYGEGHSGWNR
ncbi:MAG: hypothetical protein IJ177_12865 [Fibrobacter sp.]|uniref:hypothetical protein n=1 Tax=Fibrobacter sp. TaxID=35828 RepID=UPI0025BFAB84|nr:hypothetical protein [Fibrobacter sp.]MBQ9227048.1 hypothetical protein [Fibrobacter sp.]